MILTLSQANELIAQKDAQIGELTRKLESVQRQLATLQHQMEQMLRRLYGRKSEQLNPNQMMFDSIILESLEQNTPQTSPAAEAPVAGEVVKTRKVSQHHGRVPIPEHLERVEILLDIPEEQKVCPETGEPLKVITVEVSEKLEYRPGKLIVNVYKRPQYALPRGDSFAGVIAAAMPDHPIAKCKADVGLIAHLIVSKFADHLPLYRQDGIFEREGVTIPRATQSSWLMQVYQSVHRLEGVFRRAVLESDVAFTDDAPVPLQVKLFFYTSLSVCRCKPLQWLGRSLKNPKILKNVVPQNSVIVLDILWLFS
jgi:transposase